MQSAPTRLHEVRIYGLSINVSTAMLSEYLGKSARTRGILLHPQTKGTFQWAQVYVDTETEVESLLSLRDTLTVRGITISRVGGATTPPQTSWDVFSQLVKSRPVSSAFEAHRTSPIATADGSHIHPRNLYVLNLPLDLTQEDFMDLFKPFGVVEHSLLLSQLDSIGRRRGFVLMSTYREAFLALNQMHGKWLDGFKLDVSWALRQREGKSNEGSSLPNRVVHPPAISSRRESSPGCSVLVENLDPTLYPDSESVMTFFRFFGPIKRTFKLTGSSAAIQFEKESSAIALSNANGGNLSNRILKTRILDDEHSSAFDPFADGYHDSDPFSTPSPFHKSQESTHGRPASWASTRLNADSAPFVPGRKSPLVINSLLSSSDQDTVYSRPGSTRSNSATSLKPSASPISPLSCTGSATSVTMQDTV